MKSNGDEVHLAGSSQDALRDLTPVHHRQRPHSLYATSVDQAPEPSIELRIGQQWRELRRGAGMNALLAHLLGTGDDALEPGEWDTLELLAQQSAWRMGDLARALRVDPSTATRAVQRLIRSGLAERSSCTQDGRVTFVMLSSTGLERYRSGIRRRQQVMRTMLNEFSGTERELLANLLERLVSALDEFVHSLEPERELMPRG
jgi:DNA-binding MarR family transcriptional regulator